ncbi:hypothetical protein J3459_007623 [Metarhizium acridum]|nr:hypothetical protein J3459_007623 [Metarhizium acridum]
MTPGQSETPVPIPVPSTELLSIRAVSNPQFNKQQQCHHNHYTCEAARGNSCSVATHRPTEVHDASRATLPRARQERDSRRSREADTARLSPPDVPSLRPPSRGQTPIATRPGSRGKAASQEPPSLASDRPRRSSTARNTPIPEFKQPAKRTKRPAPGVVSTTNSGGSSAVGKRKAAPKKKARATKREKGQVLETEMEEVDDEGNQLTRMSRDIVCAIESVLGP